MVHFSQRAVFLRCDKSNITEPPIEMVGGTVQHFPGEEPGVDARPELPGRLRPVHVAPVGVDGEGEDGVVAVGGGGGNRQLDGHDPRHGLRGQPDGEGGEEEAILRRLNAVAVLGAEEGGHVAAASAVQALPAPAPRRHPKELVHDACPALVGPIPLVRGGALNKQNT